MSLDTNENCLSNDDCSSIYSRSPESPKLHSKSNASISRFALRALPEINSLDHQIAMAHGTTIALETTRTRLRGSKGYPGLSLEELQHQKLQQLEQHKHENNFYRICHQQFLELSKVVVDVAQDLTLQYHFEPGLSYAGNTYLLRTIQILRESLEDSKIQEASAEQEWKRQWNVSRISSPTTHWI